MGDQITDRQDLKRKAETLTDSEISEVLDYITIMESLREQAGKPDLFDDELMNMLADALAQVHAGIPGRSRPVQRGGDGSAASASAQACALAQAHWKL